MSDRPPWLTEKVPWQVVQCTLKSSVDLSFLINGKSFYKFSLKWQSLLGGIDTT